MGSEGGARDASEAFDDGHVCLTPALAHRLEAEAAAGALEEEPLPEGFAARVREAAMPAAPWWSHPLLHRVAAGIVIVLSVAGAYHLGRDHGARNAAGSSDSQFDSVELTPVRYDQGMRAARSLLDDVGTIDRVPERLRRPLLRATMDHFELPAWARAVRRQDLLGEAGRLAGAVEDLALMLRSEGTSLREIQEQFRGYQELVRGYRYAERGAGRGEAGETLSAAASGVLRRRERLAEVLTSAARDLPGSAREALGHYLRVKDAAVFGVPAPEVMQMVIPDVSDWGNVFSISVGHGEDPAPLLQQRLEAMFGVSGGARAIRVEQESRNGRSTYRVIIRSSDGAPREGKTGATEPRPGRERPDETR